MSDCGTCKQSCPLTMLLLFDACEKPLSATNLPVWTRPHVPVEKMQQGSESPRVKQTDDSVTVYNPLKKMLTDTLHQVLNISYHLLQVPDLGVTSHTRPLCKKQIFQAITFIWHSPLLWWGCTPATLVNLRDRGTPPSPPSGPKFLHFHRVFVKKNSQIIGWRPFRGRRRSLWQILYPPHIYCTNLPPPAQDERSITNRPIQIHESKKTSLTLIILRKSVGWSNKIILIVCQGKKQQQLFL